jgi:hypothetical protein
MARARRLLCLLGTVALAATAARPVAAQRTPPARNRPLIAMIDEFLQHPFSEDLRVELLDSANVREDVLVSITASVTPFLCYSDTAAVIRALDALLLTAYVSGNMREQLVRGRSADQPEAGLRGVLVVYDVIRSRVRDYRVPEVDAWSQALTAGQLTTLADSLRQDTGDCIKKPARFAATAALHTVSP